LITCHLSFVHYVEASQPVSFDSRYMKGNTKGKPGKPNIKPPDLWIHHDQMELKALEKTQSGAGVGGGDGPSGVPTAVTTLPRTSGGQDFDSGDPHHHSNSLDKRTYVSSYIGKGN
jgi:hypothetical protein